MNQQRREITATDHTGYPNMPGSTCSFTSIDLEIPFPDNLHRVFPNPDIPGCQGFASSAMGQPAGTVPH